MSESANDKAFIKDFGANLRRIRKSKKMSMEDLSHVADMEYSQISRIERGVINTKISTVNALARALEIPVKDLFEF
ncbi:helix-turn-helix transcriptional regulator [Hyunsoonleella aquatilis]